MPTIDKVIPYDKEVEPELYEAWKNGWYTYWEGEPLPAERWYDMSTTASAWVDGYLKGFAAERSR